MLAKDYLISSDPDDPGLCGASSGAIAAFTAAWERPDHFRRVYSMIGTYVGLRGGNEYPTLIRQTEPKPLRIFCRTGKTISTFMAVIDGWRTRPCSGLLN